MASSDPILRCAGAGQVQPFPPGRACAAPAAIPFSSAQGVSAGRQALYSFTATRRRSRAGFGRGIRECLGDVGTHVSEMPSIISRSMVIRTPRSRSSQIPHRIDGFLPNDDFALNRKFWSKRSIFIITVTCFGSMLRLHYPFFLHFFSSPSATDTFGSPCSRLPFLSSLSPGPPPIPLLLAGEALRAGGGGRCGDAGQIQFFFTFFLLFIQKILEKM